MGTEEQFAPLGCKVFININNICSKEILSRCFLALYNSLRLRFVRFKSDDNGFRTTTVPSFHSVANVDVIRRYVH